MTTNKLDKNCAVDLIITSTRNVSGEILMAQSIRIKEVHCQMVNKTLEAIRDANSRQH